MLSDDVYRDRLRQAIDALEAWAESARTDADIETSATATFWKMSVRPRMPGACPFDLMLQSNQTFTLDLAGERYEDKPIDKLDFFLTLARAVEQGRIARVETRGAATGILETLEMRVELDDGWAWIGERRVGPRFPRSNDADREQRSHRFLPYRR